jgi:hypothetical protein
LLDDIDKRPKMGQYGEKSWKRRRKKFPKERRSIGEKAKVEGAKHEELRKHFIKTTSLLF